MSEGKPMKQETHASQDSSNGTKMKKEKKGRSGKIPKELLTPEYIEQKRREREEAKAIKRQALIDKGLDPDNPEGSNYIKRQLIPIPHEEKTKPAISFKLMSYNLLAQALIRRTLFPENGDILKWHKRSKVLLQEIKDYDCDIMCLQEVDYTQYKSFWRPELQKIGYHTKFHRGHDKNHGVSIFFKEKLFTVVDTCLIDFDKETSGTIPPRTVTKNAGMILGLALKDDPTKILTVGTAHLFWHPFGTYERTRQTYLVLSKSAEFEKRIRTLNPNVTKVWKFFAGDFNSQPFDAPYLSITSKPVSYDQRCLRVISCSTSYVYSKLREGGSADDEEGGNIEKNGENQPKDPVPQSYTPTKEQVDLVNSIENLHNRLPYRAISLYSLGYKYVDSTNAGIDNERGEPYFSNWAHKWRGMLDYIFFIRDWDLEEDVKEVDSLSKFESENDLVLQKLLKLPHPDEMDKGQPREGEYPSDHLCLVAQVGLVV